MPGDLRMGQQIITLAASASAGDAVSRWWRPIAAAWPRHAPPPEVRTVPLAEIAARLDRSEEAAHLSDSGPLLIVLGPDLSGSALLKLVDHLQQHTHPGVLLFPSVDAPTRALQAGGLLVETWN